MRSSSSTLFLAATLGLAACAATGPTAVSPAPLAAEAFASRVLVTGLDFPWDMVWGPDNYLWVTERQGKRITRVDPESGEKQVAATLPAAHAGPQHEGVLGLALAPDFLQPGSRNYVYTSYTYLDGQNEHARIARLQYDPQTRRLGQETSLLDGLPAGNDHNGGRLRFGPDGKLYYTLGEQGHNQGANFCKPILAQRAPTQAEVDRKDYSAYAGKTLRLEADGSIPADNPLVKGVRSHLFTYGHRNPQGLAFVGDILYSTEQGPSSDDELNILVPGGNYGWPQVAGFRDDAAYAYANYSAAAGCAALKFDPNAIPKGVPIQKESEWNAPDFQAPLKTFFTVRDGYAFTDATCGDLSYLCWPTIAPSSVAYYPRDGKIKGWGNSLLITSLKNGALYRVPLSADGKGVQGDVAKYF
ncbi:MAG: PQQ-dependent sugar dehydrogenase, partial [Candidatus Accumulibacter sp.]|nr:PQQ-dependent sugar dehydrogenase [Accumulibacter sp.]